MLKINPRDEKNKKFKRRVLDKLTVQNGGDVNRCASSYNILGLEVKHLRSKKNQNHKTNKTKTNGTIEISLISYEYFVVGFRCLMIIEQI